MRRQKFPLLLLMPFILSIILLLGGVTVCIVQSFGVIPSLGLTKPSLHYFADLVSGKVGASSGNLLKSTGMSLYIALLSSLFAAVVGVFLCWAMTICNKATGVLRQVLTIPIMLPHLVVALFTIFLFSQSGIFPRILYTLGLLPSQDAFPALLYAENGIGILMAYLWKGIPFVCFFVLPAMSGIDNVLYEAACSMGATGRKVFFHITLPICLPTILGAFFILLAYNFGAYELPFLLGATSPKALPVQAYIEYMHPDLLHRPYAMAMNTVMLAISLIFAFLWRWADCCAHKQTGGNIQ